MWFCPPPNHIFAFQYLVNTIDYPIFMPLWLRVWFR